MTDETEVFVPADDGPVEVTVPPVKIPREVIVGEKKKEPTLLGIGFYLVNGITKEIYRENGVIMRAEKRFAAQRLLCRVNQHEWTIIEVTVENFAWGE